MKRILIWIGGIIALIAVAALALPLFIDANSFRPQLESNLKSALGRAVKLGELKLALLAGGITATDISIDDDPAFSKSPFLRAKELNVGVELATLIFSRKLVVTGLNIDQPEIALVESAPGVWNFSSIGTSATQSKSGTSSSAPLDLSVKLVKIANGRLSVTRGGPSSKPVVLEQVEIELQNFSTTTAFPFSLAGKIIGGGTIKLNGTAGPINATDTAKTPVNAKLTVDQLDLALSRMNDWAPSLAGVVSLDGTATSDGKTIHISGKLKGDKLKLARNATPAQRTVEVDFALDHDVLARSGTLTQGDIHVGGALAHLTGTYAEQGQSMLLKMNLTGSNMPVTELEGLFPAVGIKLPSGSSLQSGSATASLNAAGPADQLVTTGSISLANAKLAGFDMGRKMSAIEKLAGIKSTPETEIQSLSANVRYAPEGANIQDLKLVANGIGEISGSGTISPQEALNFKMAAVVHAVGLATVLGNTPVPFTIEGTASDPQFRPDVKGIAADALKNAGSDPLKAGKAATGILKGILGGKKP